MVETAVAKMLENLDPHTVYVSAKDVELSMKKCDSDNLISFRERAVDDQFMVDKGNDLE